MVVESYPTEPWIVAFEHEYQILYLFLLSS